MTELEQKTKEFLKELKTIMEKYNIKIRYIDYVESQSGQKGWTTIENKYDCDLIYTSDIFPNYSIRLINNK